MSDSTFESFNLHPLINKAIALCGYTTPTPIQLKSIPVILDGKDFAGSAQTGTGKTGAFVLPILHKLASQPKSKKTRILILTPTRELAAQITKAANTYGKFLQFNITSIVGGVSYEQQIRSLKQGAEIIIATPGRLKDHIESKRIDLSYIDTLVLDEADRMLDMGFIDDVRLIAEMTPDNRQTLLFSATLDNKLMSEVRDLQNQPVRVDLSSKQLTAPKIKQTFYRVKHLGQKYTLLKQLLQNEAMFKAIIFTATKIHADQLADEMNDLGYSTKPLHGNLKQSARNRAIQELQSGRVQFLVATDVAARGIDIQDITHVINFDLPKFCEDYVHRIGRTGRAGKEGEAISFVSPVDMKHVTRIERYIGERIKVDSSWEQNARSEPRDDQEKSEEKPFRKYADAPEGRSYSDRSSDRSRRPAERSFADRGASDRSDRGRRSSERGSFADRGASSERSERPKRAFGAKSSERGGFADRGASSERSERPKRAFGGKSSERGSFADRGASSERSERPKRAFGGKSSERGGFADRGASSERSERPKRAFGGKSSERGGFADRGASSERSERPKKSYSPRSMEGGAERKEKPKNYIRPAELERSSDKPFTRKKPLTTKSTWTKKRKTAEAK